MLEITFLGTSGGVPTVERNLPSLALKYENQLLLFDCGEGTQRQLMKYRIGYGSVNAIFITHPHLDHYLGLYGFIETLKLSSIVPKPLFLCGPSKVLEFEKYKFITEMKIKGGELYKKDDFSINAFAVKHVKDSFGLIFEEKDSVRFYEEKAHSLGLKGPMFRQVQQKGFVETDKGKIMLEEISYVKKGRKIVYTGDCRPSETTIEAALNADLLIHESTYMESQKEEALERMHSTALEAAEIAKKAKVKKLILTHFSPRYNDLTELLAEAKKTFENTELAHDGLKIEIR